MIPTTARLRQALSAAALAALAALLIPGPTWAQSPPAVPEAAIRKNLSERLPGLPKIDEIRRTPMANLFEVRVGNEIYYSDAQGNHLIQGQLIDTRSRRDLTQERLDRINAIAFDSLPLKDAITLVRGNGKRKLAVFEDPNCGYCKRFERDLQKVNDVTVHLFLMPILGPDSIEQSRNVWCARDKVRAWSELMLSDMPPPTAAAGCDSAALTRNVEFARKMRITGTPTLVFANGTRVPGAIGAAQVEKLLAEASAP